MATAKKPTLEPIHAQPEFKAASAILQTLEAGFAALGQEKRALEIELSLPKGKPKTERTKHAHAQLTSYRAKVPRKVTGAVPPNVPPAVHVALELLQGDSKLVVRAERASEDLRALIAHVRADMETVRAGVVCQHGVLDEIRDRLSFETATRLKAAHRELILAKYRAAQQLSAATTAEHAFHREFTANGFVWRPDVLISPGMRCALAVGDESVWDSEISRTRRTLEEAKIL